MPSAVPIESWQSWPNYTAAKAEVCTPGELSQYKKDIAAIYGEEAIRQSWLKVCKELEVLTDEIAEKGTSIIPEVQFDELFNLGENRRAELKKRGAFVVRGVVSEEQATSWFEGLKTYYQDNKPNVGGWPLETPFVLRMYWSPTQLAARSHPNHLKVQKFLNEFWHSYDSASSADPLSYADAVRIRPPKIPFPGLGPHIDAGSLSRWTEPTYREVYKSIFSGNPEVHDCYSLANRAAAQQSSAFEKSYHSTVLRAFQGWTALTPAGPREGSLLLYPDVKTTIAYVLLRPFFRAPDSEKDIMDASKWTLDLESDWFPGTWRNESQRASPESHPHLRITECMVNIPKMGPGDTIWWHCDMLHAVEVEHEGEYDASVVYVAATPTTEINKTYMREQVKAFLNGGSAPSDFSRSVEEGRREGDWKGWVGEAGILSGDAGRRAAGLVGL